MVVEMYQFLGEPLKNYIYYIISPLIFSSFLYVTLSAKNGRYPPTQNGDIRSLLALFRQKSLQN